MRNFVYVVIKAKYGACKQESLCNIHQCAIGYVLKVKHLYKSKCNATDYQ